jgi:hypothetical protein
MSKSPFLNCVLWQCIRFSHPCYHDSGLVSVDRSKRRFLNGRPQGAVPSVAVWPAATAIDTPLPAFRETPGPETNYTDASDVVTCEAALHFAISFTGSTLRVFVWSEPS